MKFSDAIFDWLKEIGFTHCYFVAGGNIMHLLNSARQRMRCIPVVHEVAAVIATEYHNSSLSASSKFNRRGRALALVTAGPGLTNAITGLSGAWLESRELLLLGGQVKVEDLSNKSLRQLGIQEVDGVSLASPVCKRSICLRKPFSRHKFIQEVSRTFLDRPGPVFLELPLDVQAADVSKTSKLLNHARYIRVNKETINLPRKRVLSQIASLIELADRPLLLIGGGVSRSKAHHLEDKLIKLSLPIMTTWNGADRYGSDHSNYYGRPNTWGQRYSNLLIQQADLVLVLGSRLGLQQTGFNWKKFVPNGNVIQVDIDTYELRKKNPKLLKGINIDADIFLERLLEYDLGKHSKWLEYCSFVKSTLPISEPCNITPKDYLNPYDVVIELSKLCSSSDHLIPCSSGGAFTVMMQAFNIKQGQKMITNKGLASMGYGLAGAIGTAIANPLSRTILVEGDGGFTQNLQELATVMVNSINLKIFLFCNDGYASIRMTQKNYFDGQYIGCDISSGLGFPCWDLLAKAYGIEVFKLTTNWQTDQNFQLLWDNDKPVLFLVPIYPEQTYFPKISSKISSSGSMESNPLHQMSPELSDEVYKMVSRFIPYET